MQGVGVVPGIIDDLGSAMEVGCHGEALLLCKCHHPLRLRCVRILVGMRTFVRVWIVAIHVHPLGIVARGAIDGIIAAIVGAVGI